MNKEKAVEFGVVVFGAWFFGMMGLTLSCQVFDLTMPWENTSYLEELIATVLGGAFIGATGR